MKYYYEYKEKNGCKAGGHNLETIDFFDNYIRLLGVDIIQTNYGYKEQLERENKKIKKQLEEINKMVEVILYDNDTLKGYLYSTNEYMIKTKLLDMKNYYFVGNDIRDNGVRFRTTSWKTRRSN